MAYASHIIGQQFIYSILNTGNHFLAVDHLFGTVMIYVSRVWGAGNLSFACFTHQTRTNTETLISVPLTSRGLPTALATRLIFSKLQGVLFLIE